MGKRFVTSVVGLPVLMILIILGGIPLRIALTIVVVGGMYEVYHAFAKKLLPVHYIGFAFAAVYMLFINYISRPNAMNVLTVLFTFCVLAALVVFHKTTNIIDCCVTLFGFYYVAVLLSSAYLVRTGNHGAYIVWIIFISAWGCDTGAYFTGITFGKHKLIPTLSPNKTWEGSIGGTLTATLLTMLYAFVLCLFGVFEYGIIIRFGVIGFFGSIIAQFGDLSASAIKRYTGIKDFGKILPGHGGFIDRVDSVLFTSAAVYLMTMLLIR